MGLQLTIAVIFNRTVGSVFIKNSNRNYTPDFWLEVCLHIDVSLQLKHHRGRLVISFYLQTNGDKCPLDERRQKSRFSKNERIFFIVIYMTRYWALNAIMRKLQGLIQTLFSVLQEETIITNSILTKHQS